MIGKALIFLAENDRPSEGQVLFNSEHLYQLADESDRRDLLLMQAFKYLTSIYNESMPLEISSWLKRAKVQINQMENN